MKKAAGCFLKQVGSAVLGALFKANSSAAVKINKTRLVLFGLLIPNKQLLPTAISKRTNALTAGTGHSRRPRYSAEEEEEDPEYCAEAREPSNLGLLEPLEYYCYNFLDEFPDLTHCLFDSEEDEEEEDAAAGLQVRISSREADGGEFNLEDEIDRVADVFIRRFRRQMRSAAD